MAISYSYRSTVAATLLALVSAVGPAQAATPVAYVLSELTPLAGGTEVYATGIDNQGRIVGASEYGLGGAMHATLWANGTVMDLGTLGGEGSGASAISSTGRILGVAYTASPQGGDGVLHNVVWQAQAPQTTATDLGPVGPGHVAISAISGADWMAGTQFDDASGGPHAVVISQGASTALGTLGGIGSVASGVNGHGDVVGASQRADGGQMQATLWQGQTAIDLGVTGANGSKATAINDVGQIIGSVVDEMWRTTALKWDNGQVTRLEDLGTGFARALGINNAGLVVGTSQSADFSSLAVMWDGTHIIDLNKLLTDDERAAGWQLLDAVAVNDGGVIIGDALKNNVLTTFVLTPVPEAGTSAMTLLGLALMAGLSRRRKGSAQRG